MKILPTTFTNTKYDILGWKFKGMIRGWITKTAYPQVYQKRQYVEIPIYHNRSDLYPQFYPKKMGSRITWWLKIVAGLMKDQDNYATKHPMYVVQQRRRIYGMDRNYADHIAFMYEGEEITNTEDPDCNEELEGFKKEFEDPHIDEVGYIETWEFLQPFFSERAALNFIDNNQHRYEPLRLFVDSGHRNYEWQMIQEILESMA